MQRHSRSFAAIAASVLVQGGSAGAAYAQAQATTSPIYDTSGNNVVPGQFYQLSVVTNDYILGFAKDSSNMCIGSWLGKSGSPVQYARLCSNLDCTSTSNGDSVVVQVNCGYLKVVGSTVRMTVVKEDATWFNAIPNTLVGRKGYKLRVRNTSAYLDVNDTEAPITIVSNVDQAIWMGLAPISGNPTTCNHVATGCSSLMPDRMVNNPVYTDIWKNAYLPTKCGNSWKAPPLYHKTMLNGFKAFKQDNNWDNGRLATQLVDYARFNGGDISPTPLLNNRKMKWYSDRRCYSHQSVGCSIPGLCGGGGSWAGIVVVIFAWLDHESSGGKYCAGTPAENTSVDCCARAANEDGKMSPTYYFEQGGSVSVDNKQTWFPMYYVYSYRWYDQKKVYMRNECDGDDIYWGEKDPSYIYFTNHSVSQGQVWISTPAKNAKGEEVTEEAQDTYVTPQNAIDPNTLPKEGEIEFKDPLETGAPAPEGGAHF